MAATKRIFAVVVLIFLTAASHAAVIPEDRADVLYHAYDGGGVTVQGPSVLVRKGFKDKVSFSANYYEDFVSSASIDVISKSSGYEEHRTEYSVGGDYLYHKTMLTLHFANSTENDFIADTTSFGISQDFFGDMSTLSLGYTEGDDIIRATGSPEFEEEAKRRRYSLGWSQVLSKNWILSFSLETAVDDGYLQNPYRNVWILTSQNGDLIRQSEDEIYPTTRNSDAVALRTMYYLPNRSSIRIEARAFADSWGIEAQNYELRYTQPFREKMIIEAKLRYYDQGAADFFNDLIDPNAANQNEFRGRDKELSQYNSFNFGAGLTYTLDYRIPHTKDLKFSAYWDFFKFDYKNFRNVCKSNTGPCGSGEYLVGEEPTYGFDANVLRIFMTVNY